jgi:hypothetical protein
MVGVTEVTVTIEEIIHALPELQTGIREKPLLYTGDFDFPFGVGHLYQIISTSSNKNTFVKSFINLLTKEREKAGPYGPALSRLLKGWEEGVGGGEGAATPWPSPHQHFPINARGARVRLPVPP